MAGRDGEARQGPRRRAKGERISTVVLVVAEGTSPRRSGEMMRWVRALLPAALILVSSAPLAAPTSDDVITVNVDEVDAGPLAVAAALGRTRSGRD
ncbi:MAG TPA: hypothetical protein VF841_15325 [Anaeromyxobacter sp.]